MGFYRGKDYYCSGSGSDGVMVLGVGIFGVHRDIIFPLIKPLDTVIVLPP